ncbi:DNA topoisomerase I [bacterium SM23_57]|nr:MAG: DNA topoisomerase I [bacterium SM23_57]
MPDTLVIVESPAKAKTIHKFLGTRYSVQATVGHVMDLPPKKLGVNIRDHFQPEYQIISGKEKVIKSLRASAKEARSVLLATDPDREGEAIAHHVVLQLRLPKDRVGRVLFNEITKRAVTEAVKHPGVINQNKVEAQQARRVLDRLVGYMVSPILWKTVAKGLSAGRVQSVALRLICEREEAIRAFVAEEYWSITATVQGSRTDAFATKLEKIDGKKAVIPNQEEAQRILDDITPRTFIVEDIQKKKTSQRPSPPFITSTLQQEAFRRYKFTAKKTMRVAQSLYEGVELGDEGPTGLITYMRTDSTRIAPEAIQMVRDYILTSYGQDYLPNKPRVFAKVKAAQEAHEAIRPTSMKWDPKSAKKYLTADQQRLYDLIWNRFVASQMKDARIETITLIISAGPYEFRTSASNVLFLGFRQVYQEMKENNKAEALVVLPDKINVGESLRLLQLDPKQHFTQPPPRFAESSIIKEMEQNGIGRPSTYAQIISTLYDRKYVVRDGGKLVPTELGVTVNRILVSEFPDVFSVDFTARMEKKLDGIEMGDDSLQVLDDFYGPFQQTLDVANSRRSEIRKLATQDTDETCPDCGSPLIIRWGRSGKFIACTAFPKCRFTRNLEESEAPNHVDKACPKCGGALVIKNGRYGPFLGCSNYPKCRHVEPYDTGISCPRGDCGGKIVERRSKKGRTFYGCSKYPKCDFISSYPLVAESCPNCDYSVLEDRNTSRGHYRMCPNCKTRFSVDEAVENE